PALIATSRPSVPHSSTDQPRGVSIVPMPAESWSGTPALAFHRAGKAPGQLELVGIDTTPAGDATAGGATITGPGAPRARFVLRDAAAEVQVAYDLWLSPSGILSVCVELTSSESTVDVVDVAALRALLPVPGRARELLDFTGRWSGERHAQRSRLTDGTRL